MTRLERLSLCAITLGGVFLLGGLSAVARASESDIARGKLVFKECAACHAVDDRKGVGPGLGGILGRRAGSVAGFRYSHAMKNAGLNWDERTLDKYIASPQTVVPGNRMAFSGIPNPGERAALIAYLSSLKRSAN